MRQRIAHRSVDEQKAGTHTQDWSHGLHLLPGGPVSSTWVSGRFSQGGSSQRRAAGGQRVLLVHRFYAPDVTTYSQMLAMIATKLRAWIEHGTLLDDLRILVATGIAPAPGGIEKLILGWNPDLVLDPRNSLKTSERP